MTPPAPAGPPIAACGSACRSNQRAIFHGTAQESSPFHGADSYPTTARTATTAIVTHAAAPTVITTPTFAMSRMEK